MGDLESRLRPLSAVAFRLRGAHDGLTPEAVRLNPAAGRLSNLISSTGRPLPSALAGSVHPLLATRGPPGTHDVALGQAVLDHLDRGETLRLPRFDKAEDDRAPEQDWEPFEGPADVVLFEEWYVGARPQAEAALLSPVNELERREDPDAIWRRSVNEALGRYQALFERLDVLVQLAPAGFEVVANWHREQEAKLRATRGCGGAGVVGDEEVSRFVARCLGAGDGPRQPQCARRPGRGGGLPAGCGLR